MMDMSVAEKSPDRNLTSRLLDDDKKLKSLKTNKRRYIYAAIRLINLETLCVYGSVEDSLVSFFESQSISQVVHQRKQPVSGKGVLVIRLVSSRRLGPFPV
jgi:hypothetical protein